MRWASMECPHKIRQWPCNESAISREMVKLDQHKKIIDCNAEQLPMNLGGLAVFEYTIQYHYLLEYARIKNQAEEICENLKIIQKIVL